MYMTRVTLDMSRRDTQRAFNRPQLFHQAIESSFPGPRARRLWRLDTLAGSGYLLVVSEDSPDLSKVALDYGPQEENDNNWRITEYGPFLDNLEVGQQWHFRLAANPIKSVKQEGLPREARGRIVALAGLRDQLEWLWERADQIGVGFGRETLEVVGSEWSRFEKNNNKGHVNFRKVTFEGLLTIKNVDLLREALVNGIGRQKAYGCGMLTLAPLRSG